MALMETPKVSSGWKAEDFKLTGTDGKDYSLEDVRGEKGLVVMFICNHCPYVKAIIDKIVRDAMDLQDIGIGVVAICSNDAAQYPEDGIEPMRELARKKGFSFPYVVDDTQEVAKAYGAVCTPDFFGFDKNLELRYRGRLDSSGMSSDPKARRELFEAMQHIAEGGDAPARQAPSMGCSIKWKSEAA